jgi:hypothetical protein
MDEFSNSTVNHLLALKRAGKLSEVWIDGGIIRVLYADRGYKTRVGWHRAALLTGDLDIDTGREVRLRVAEMARERRRRERRQELLRMRGLAQSERRRVYLQEVGRREVRV